MIQISDNDAANELTNLLGSGDDGGGRTRVNDFANAMCCESTRYNRMMLTENHLENYTTSEDCATLLRRIYFGQCVSQAYSEEMLELLKGQTRNQRIPAKLPAGTPVAHKNGELPYSLCDVGIVFSPSCSYILCMLVNDYQNTEEIFSAMSDLSLEIYTILE